MSKVKSDGSSASYYVLPQGATQLQELISHKNMNAQIGEIFRACYRYGEVSHSDMLRDAKKIKFYAEAEIARLEAMISAPKPLRCEPGVSITEYRCNQCEAAARTSCKHCGVRLGYLHKPDCHMMRKGKSDVKIGADKYLETHPGLEKE